MRLLRRPLQLSFKDRSLRFTPEGLRFSLITLGVGVAALNTGNNLLYMILAMMLSLIVVSGVLSEQSVKKISLSRSLPQNMFAASPFLVELRLTNLKRLIPSFSLEIEDIAEGRVLMGSHYVLKIPARHTLCVTYRGQVQRRGRYTFTGFRLTTRYPFGLFIKTREIQTADETLVYPKILSEQFQRLKSHGDGRGNFPILKRASDGDFLGLRDYRPGDDYRSIHWKSSAKVSNLMIKEFETDQTDHISILLDRSLPRETPNDPEGVFETAVSIAATVTLRLDERGCRTRLLTQGDATSFGQGTQHVLNILRVLSLLEPDTLITKDFWSLLGPWNPRQGSALVISARSDSIRGIPESSTCIRVLDFHQPNHRLS